MNASLQIWVRKLFCQCHITGGYSRPLHILVCRQFSLQHLVMENSLNQVNPSIPLAAHFNKKIYNFPGDFDGIGDIMGPYWAGWLEKKIIPSKCANFFFQNIGWQIFFSLQFNRVNFSFLSFKIQVTFCCNFHLSTYPVNDLLIKS